jgi:uncharacterized protein YbaA (DUF1428 family)
MAYVDGFVLPVPTKNVKAYARIAHKAGKIWREHGALDYRECVGDPRLAAMMKPGAMPFDVKRVVCGGFRVLVSA